VDDPKHLTDPHQIVKDLMRSHYSDDLGYYTIHIPNDYIHENLGKIARALAEAAKIRERQIDMDNLKKTTVDKKVVLVCMDEMIKVLKADSRTKAFRVIGFYNMNREDDIKKAM